MHTLIRNHRALIVALATLAFAAPVSAATRTYTGPDGGNWSNPSNWTPNVLPVTGDSVLITSASPLTVNVDVAFVDLNSLTSTATLDFSSNPLISVNVTSFLDLGSATIIHPDNIV